MSFLGLHDEAASSDPLKRRLRMLLPSERLEEAMQFLELYAHETQLPVRALRARRREVAAMLRATGHYDHSPQELAFGARVAWRNSANCVGRLFWKSLQVIDCRQERSPDAIAARVVDHLAKVNSEPKAPSVISVFSPVRPAEDFWYIENAQATQYAGYLAPDGTVLGDPASAELTRTAEALGWRARRRSRFDVLPLILRDQRGSRRLYELPRSCYKEIALAHPEQPRLAECGLRWYSIPVVTDMIMTIGGIDYPCAPFNGFYVATEIASRNLVDAFRYNVLDEAARAMSIDRSDRLWKDETLTELNRAVLASFDAAGATICDHHAASDWYVAFEQNEHASGRWPSSNWQWIVAPQASAGCATFHLPMRNANDVPNFYRSRASDGAELGVDRAMLEDSGWQRRRDRFRRMIRRRLRGWAG